MGLVSSQDVVDWLEDSDIENLLTQWGITIPANAELGSAILAIAQTSKMVGFTLEAEDATEYFDPPCTKGVLQLPTPWAVIDSVSIGAGYDLTPTELVESRDYQLIRHRFVTGETTIIGIRFLIHPGSSPQSIIIEGKLGAFETVPDQIIAAATAIGAATLAATSASTSTGSGEVSELKSGAVTVKYSTTSQSSSWDGLNAKGKAAKSQAEAILQGYRILRVW